jgi:DNA-binding GntR family transcriptional regulator
MMHPPIQSPSPTALDSTFSTVESEVVDRIRRAILTGELPPGTRMRQAELAERMSISITPIRTALRQLAVEGLVHVDPRKTVSVHQPSPEELDEIYMLRGLLEPACMAKAAVRMTEAELTRAQELVDAMDARPNARQWDVLNREFHVLLINASGSPRLTGILINLLGLASIGMRVTGVLSDERMREANDEHRRLLAACRDRDEEAARDMTLTHLRSSMRQVAIATGRG